MAFKLTGNTVIGGNTTLASGIYYTGTGVGINLRNETGQISIEGTSPMAGTVAGYSAGGFPRANIIDKFPFSSDTNASDIGDLTVNRNGVSGESSSTHGYVTGGGIGPAIGLNTIDKFPFASNGNAVDVGNLTRTFYIGSTGHSSITHGYVSSGFWNPGGGYAAQNIIDRFPFSSDTNALDVGDLAQLRYSVAGQSSSTHGYISGGQTATPPVVWYNTIEKFAFSASANATDVGDLTQVRSGATGQSSSTDGYTSGGAMPPSPTASNTIDKFPFSSDTNASDVGDLTVARILSAGSSSTVSGYTIGGSPGPSNVIDKFPFAVNANATDVGDLTSGRYSAGGHQD